MKSTRSKSKIAGLFLALLVLITTLGAFSVTAFAAESTIIAQGECGAEGSIVQWTLDDAGTLTISGTGAMADQLDNYNNRPWEAYVDQITTIVVNEGITTIGEYAFCGFQQLTTAKLPDSLTTISSIAFGGCTALKSVNLPANLKTIEGWAFQGCYALESVTLPEGLTTVDMYAFSECINLTSVSVPASVTTIGERAFGFCPAKITVDEDNLNYSSDEHGVLFDKGKTTLMYCRPNIEVETYTIPSTVTDICKSAFYECKNLVTIIIPKGVTTIGEQAFSGCEALTAITVPAGVTTIEFNTFYGCTSLTTVTIPASVTSIGSNSFSNCSALTTVNVPCTWDGSLYTFDESVNVNKVHNWANGTCAVCGASCDHKDSTHTTATNNGDGTHSFECSVCVNTVIEDHSTTADGDKAANCGSKAYCSECDSEYGDVDKTNHDDTVKYENGFCPNCDVYEPATDSNSDGYYEIANAGQLFWYANYINTIDRTANAVLTADIDLEDRPWTPIGVMGEDSNSFHGVFDGQYHTIIGLNVTATSNGAGFFGEVRTGTVKNFTIYGEVVVNAEVDYVGGVIGSICGLNGENDLYRNGAEIQNITSYVNVTAKAHGVGMIGGFVGYADHQSLIEKCSWYGTFDAGIYRVDSGAGGFIGKIQENTSEVTIRNCAAYGTIKTNYEKNSFNDTPTIYMGGFLSFSNTGAKTVLENCLFAGKFERGENLTDEAFLGAFGTLRSVNSIKNCYYLGDDGLEAVHSDSPLKPGSDNVEITSVTKAQLLSGEVAYKLGEHFGQILEGENRQSYPVLGGTKVEDSQRFEIYGQQLNIGGDLSMKYYVMGYAPEFNSKALYMEFSHNGVKTKVYAGEPNADGFYVFVLEGINPQCMGDNIYAMLCYNETEVARHGYEKGKEYSVEKNLLNLLEKYKDNAALVTLIKDTLAYGEAASAYKNHQTMTGNTYIKNSSNREIPVSEADRFEIEPNMPLVEQYTVRFGTTLSIKIKVIYLSAVKVYVNGKEYVTTEEDVNRGYIIFESDPLSATAFDKDFSVIIQNREGVNYSYIHVSVNDYLYAISQSTDTSENMENMKALANALYNYGVSAQKYAASQNN